MSIAWPRRPTCLFPTAVLFCFVAVSAQAQEFKVKSLRLAQSLPAFADISAKVLPTVVTIEVENETENAAGIWPFHSYAPFEDFSSPAHPWRRNELRSLGCGFIIEKSGLIVTNYHVVREAGVIVVSTDEGQRYRARIVGEDDKGDIALLKIDADQPLPYVTLGDSDSLRVGEWVLAIGNPFGFDRSVTVGIVSAVNRYIPGNFGRFIQTDAAINPGNSGGPLVNTRGEVVGVNSEIFTRSGSSMGIGFAIPINVVKGELAELKNLGYVRRGWLGVYLQDITDDLRVALGLRDSRGALVADVVPNSPAMKAGIKRGDVIIEYDGKLVADSEMLPVMVGETLAGRTVQLKVIRDGITQQLTVSLVAAKSSSGARQRGLAVRMPKSGASHGFGIVADNLPSDWLQKLRRFNAKGGVWVKSVTPNSPAERAGLRAHDVILEIDHQPVLDVKSFESLIEARKRRPAILVLAVRDGTAFFVGLRPAS